MGGRILQRVHIHTMSFPAVISTSELATLMGVGVVRIGQLEQQGIIAKQNGQRGRWPAVASNVAYIAFCRAGKGGTGKATSGDLDPAQEAAKVNVLKQVQMADEIKRSRGDLVQSIEVEALFADMVRVVVRGLETLPDLMERDAGATGEQVVLAQGVVDAIRDRLHADMKQAANNES